MESLAESMREQPAMPRFEDGSVNLRELVRRLAENVVNAIMDAEADQLCSGGANSRNGYRERNLVTCVGDITMRIPKLRSGSFFPEDVVERYQRVDRAVVSAVAEMYATGTSTRKVQRIAEKLGISRLSKDQVSTIAKGLDADVAELMGRDLADARTPYLWLDATYVKCRRDGRVASTAVVTAIGCDEGGWRRVLGLSVVDTESYDSWLGFLRRIKGRGVWRATATPAPRRCPRPCARPRPASTTSRGRSPSGPLRRRGSRRTSTTRPRSSSTRWRRTARRSWSTSGAGTTRTARGRRHPRRGVRAPLRCRLRRRLSSRPLQVWW